MRHDGAPPPPPFYLINSRLVLAHDGWQAVDASHRLLSLAEVCVALIRRHPSGGDVLAEGGQQANYSVQWDNNNKIVGTIKFEYRTDTTLSGKHFFRFFFVFPNDNFPENNFPKNIFSKQFCFCLVLPQTLESFLNAVISFGVSSIT